MKRLFIALAGVLFLAGCESANQAINFMSDVRADVQDKGHQAAAQFVNTRCNVDGTNLEKREADLVAVNRYLADMGSVARWDHGFNCDGVKGADVVIGGDE